MGIRLSPESDAINDINITPFVDVVLVLLIIFMISTPALIYKGLNISLPVATQADTITHVTLNLRITRDGQMWLDNRKLSYPDLDRAFDRLMASKAAADAIVSADAEVSHGVVLKLADHLKSRGIKAIAFAATPAKTN